VIHYTHEYDLKIGSQTYAATHGQRCGQGTRGNTNLSLEHKEADVVGVWSGTRFHADRPTKSIATASASLRESLIPASPVGGRRR
jgi:hypothetical protein